MPQIPMIHIAEWKELAPLLPPMAALANPDWTIA